MRVKLVLAFFLTLLGPQLCLAKTPPATAAKLVDQLLAEELDHSPAQLAPRSDDATFLRRTHLDIVGDIPTPEQVTAFLLDPAPDKRQQLVRELLNQPQYGQNWARYWRDVVLYRRIEDRALMVNASLTPQLTERLNANRGWDEIAREFITATGDIREHGATALIAAQEGRTEEVAAEVSRVFLGIQIQCAQCHDHPWDSWKREQFHELAAFFPRISLRQVRTPVKRSFEVVASDRPSRRRRPNNNANRSSAEHFMPDMDDPQAAGTRMQPKFFLTSASAPFGSRDADRRRQLADWITDSPWFSKALVNRLWAELVGEPLFNSIDDIGPERVAKAPQTVEYLAEEFAASGHDLKWLLRTILATEAYQRECRPRRKPGHPPMTANVAQRLRGDQLFNALLTSLDIEEPTRGSLVSNMTGGNRAGGPRGIFNTAFGFDPSLNRESVSASIPQALALMNTPQINNATRASRRTMLGRLLAETGDDGALVDELYLRSLSRLPTHEERSAALVYRDSVDKRSEAFEDLLWALVNSAEFAHRR